MPTINRRTFLQWVAASSAAAPVVGAAGGCGGGDEQDATFPQGVASGDPTPDGVLIWTRVAPLDDAAGHVDYEVATDPDF